MTSRTAQRKAKAPPTEPEPEAQEAEWATAKLLGGDHEDTVLPVMGVKVRIRYLDTVETTRLQLLPDYIGFFGLVEQLNAKAEDAKAETPPELDSTKMLTEQVAYQAHVAHRSIVDRMHPGEVRCEDCGDPHPRSLWTLKEARRILPDDLNHITNIAMQAMKVATHRPFSKVPPQSVSSPPADTGGSTPPTNS